ncbi:DNA-binding transcriptional regulator [Mariniblastus fucicola]|uniref:Xylose operon regulatory protein n=1 Tax=Mariniblastus fucicola TaxID=980251 RepID=A0A5B9P817_9BACT|nr:DNA-binding transcriptional regulator [Mariniblastus fucicola]QEG22464.1 Xylose operon regulatory protein [Mariniblastus fucicola]
MKRSVALLIETSNEYARGLLRGVLRYQQEHERWNIDLPEQHRGAAPPKWLAGYSGDGIIARIETEAIAAAVRQSQLPAVDVSAGRFVESIPWVETDDQSISRLAISHFVKRGIQHVAFCGESTFNWSKWRRDAFVAEAKAQNLSVSVFEVGSDDNESTWSKERKRLARWLAQLPDSCGLMAAYDSLAHRVIQLCTEIDRCVPDSIAVVGVDDDPLLCQLATPSLSSIVPDAELAGYTAAEQLDAIMSGEVVPAAGTLLPPIGIATRKSSDTLAVEDPVVAIAGRYILANACNGIQVSDVVAQTDLTRRVLERRFKSSMDITPHEFIVETRLSHAERLLRETNLTLDKVAHRCGIEYAEYLNALFRKHRGMTPGEYRRQNKKTDQ